MTDGPAMKVLFKKAKRGFCHCGRRLLTETHHKRRLCGRVGCRRKYMTAYLTDHPRPSSLKRIVRVATHPKDPTHRLVFLECGHRLDLAASTAALAKTQKKCRKCA